jgi:hypothetical protein
MTAARRGLNRRSAGSALRRGLLGEGALKAPLEGRDARRPGVLGARGGDAGLASRLRNVELEAAWPGPGPVASPGPRPLAARAKITYSKRSYSTSAEEIRPRPDFRRDARASRTSPSAIGAHGFTEADRPYGVYSHAQLLTQTEEVRVRLFQFTPRRLVVGPLAVSCRDTLRRVPSLMAQLVDGDGHELLNVWEL